MLSTQSPKSYSRWAVIWQKWEYRKRRSSYTYSLSSQRPFQAHSNRQLPDQLAPVVVAFDQSRPIGSDGNIPADGAVLRVEQAGLSDHFQGFRPERELESHNVRTGDWMHGFRAAGDVGVNAWAGDDTAGFVNWRGEIAGRQVVDWRVDRDSQSAAEHMVLVVAINQSKYTHRV